MRPISKRYQKILALREKGLTFAEIGKRISVSRQRAWELWKRAFSRTEGGVSMRRKSKAAV